VTERLRLTEVEAAAYICMSVAFLRMSRCRGVLSNHTPPPPYLKLGKTVRYNRADLDRWLEDRRVDPSARRRRGAARAVAS
jgi:predicted DNA-binding transcriptional regulator AlpA